MSTLVTFSFFALVTYLTISLFFRLYRWIFKRNGKPLKLDPTEIHEVADEVAKKAHVVGGAGLLAAQVAAPAGLAALAAKIGLVSLPFMTAMAPHLTVPLGSIILICYCLSLYAKKRRRREQQIRSRSE